ncbi:MAG: hypothetical protein EB072_19120, partial [Betaproteobacteria bacterium]|nr:hypothetical protein [Betaproteobacteria bacterium]
MSVSDITGGVLSGKLQIGNDGKATINVPIAADRTKEDDETLTINFQGKAASVTIIDTSNDQLGLFNLLRAAPSANEGSNAIFYIATDSTSAGLEVPYTISGVSSSDIVGGQLSGKAVISSNGEATIDIALAEDRTTEGDETLTVTLQGKSASVIVKDTSLTPPGTYDLRALAVSVDEGATASFELTTQYVAASTSIPYTLSGVGANDLIGTPLSGSITVGSDGKAILNVPIRADQLTEGDETLKLTLASPASASAQITLKDSSTNPKIEALLATPTVPIAAGTSLDIGTHPLVVQSFTSNPTAGSLQKFGMMGRNIMDAFNLYGILGRDPDPTGLGFWVEMIEEGRKQQSDGIFNDVIAGFIGSEEFQSYVSGYQSQSLKGYNRAAVDMLYRNVLKREWVDIVNDGGAAWLSSEIDNGNRSLVSVAKQIVISAEAYNYASSVISKRNISFVTYGTLGGNYNISGTDGP